jgi:hypothetical protein
MAKLFETVKKDSTLMLNGKFNKYEGAVVAKVTLVEIYGNSLRITYQGLCEDNSFTHTITVNKKFGRNRVMIYKRKWENFKWHHLNWLKDHNLIDKQPHVTYFLNREKSTRTFRKTSEYKYDYVVTVI